MRATFGPCAFVVDRDRSYRVAGPFARGIVPEGESSRAQEERHARTGLAAAYQPWAGHDRGRSDRRCLVVDGSGTAEGGTGGSVTDAGSNSYAMWRRTER